MHPVDEGVCIWCRFVLSPSRLGQVRLWARQAQERQEGRCRRHRSRHARERDPARVRTAGYLGGG